MEFINFLKSRRSVRSFTDYEVSNSEIEKIMEGASWAPSWMNTQCWEYIVVRDKGKIKEIAGTYKLNPAYFCSRKASVIILACAKKNLSGHLAGVKTTKIENWFMFDLGLSVQNLLLTVHSLGLGAVIVGAVNRDRVKKIVELPKDYELVVAIPVGKPIEEYINKSGKRKELKHFVWKNKFGQKWIT